MERSNRAPARARDLVKRRLPWTVALVEQLRTLQLFAGYYGRVLFYKIWNPRGSVFDSIYERRTWGGESRSGRGSDLTQTEVVQEQLPDLLESLGVRSVLDAPCGDFFWMSKVSLGVDSYVGVDIVADVIERNRAEYETDGISFLCADITRDPLPRADLVLVRDCFVHLSFGDIQRALRNLRESGSEYLLTTTYPGAVRRNWNILTGWWRPLDLELAPFDFPKPDQVMHERITTPKYNRAKSLALWRIRDLPLR